MRGTRYAGRFEPEEWETEMVETDDIYGDGAIAGLLDDDELSREEEAFMRGYKNHYDDKEDYY